MSQSQLGFWSKYGQSEGRLSDCPFTDVLEKTDSACYEIVTPYEAFHCHHPLLAKELVDIKGVSFDNVVAKDIPTPQLPDFIPQISPNSSKLISLVDFPYVAVTLNKIIDKKSFTVDGNIRKRLGILPTTKLILLSYTLDSPLQKIWEGRKHLIPDLAKCGFDLVTGFDYSLWGDQPHAEKKINLKRSLITYEMLQNAGIPAIPHIYWDDNKDLRRWGKWLSNNGSVKDLAICLEETTRESDWKNTIRDLAFFTTLIDSDINFLITGPSTAAKIADLGAILPNYTLTNGNCLQKSVCYQLISEKGPTKDAHAIPLDLILNTNFTFYDRLVRESKERKNDTQTKAPSKIENMNILLLSNNKTVTTNSLAI